MRIANGRHLLISAVAGCVAAALTLELESIDSLSSNGFAGELQHFGLTVLFPGILGAMTLPGNAPGFHLWVAAIWNFVFYFLLCWAIAVLIGTVLHRLRASRRVGKS